MSEQEKKSGGSSAPLVVEPKTASKHKPIRSTELQEETVDLHRKHSRGPVVEPFAEDSIDSSQDLKGSDHEMSTDKQKQTISKKYSCPTSKRGPSMETITLAPVDIETKRDSPSSQHQQPIPANVETVASQSGNLLAVKQDVAEKKGDEDSITEEITELRTTDEAKKHSEWAKGDVKRPDEKISAPSFKYSRKTDEDMGVRSQVCMLEGKASIGPCFRDLAQYKGPSGICIYIPKKGPKCQMSNFNPIPSVLNINVSKKSITKSNSQMNHTEKSTKSTIDSSIKPENAISSSFFGGVRMKIGGLTSKIINAFNV
ncbi:uncharacterized protein LOC128674910 isoform X2 [Plodia interpunctella]|uniref:uncharacterized protein LOC128674910 isoform X2 n=1 Tax=Plodia interpunctella TaxID=58824 RepID=UPI0023688B73|nr:uncharacterized protein LOC128674910 isoform X2 [Plodia interpunctella]